MTPYIPNPAHPGRAHVVEQHVGVEGAARGSGSESIRTAWLGSYRIDLHPSTAGRTYIDIDSYPFQIRWALIPVRVDNLLPANKNIGTTHITNGCYRLIRLSGGFGEAVGALAAFCLDRGLPARKVRSDQAQLADYRDLLARRSGSAWRGRRKIGPGLTTTEPVEEC